MKNSIIWTALVLFFVGLWVRQIYKTSQDHTYVTTKYGRIVKGPHKLKNSQRTGGYISGLILISAGIGLIIIKQKYKL